MNSTFRLILFKINFTFIHEFAALDLTEEPTDIILHDLDRCYFSIKLL